MTVEVPTTTELVRTLKKLVRSAYHKNYPFCLILYVGEFEAFEGRYVPSYDLDGKKVFRPGRLSDGIGCLFDLSMSHNVHKIELTNNWKFKEVNAITLQLLPSMDGLTNINDWFIDSVNKMLGSMEVS